MIETTQLNAAVLNPQSSMIPAHLRRGTPVKKTRAGLEIPWSKSGTFASVFKFDVGGKYKAIRAFLYDVAPTMRDRYVCLARCLKGKAAAFTVAFEYHQDGLIVENEARPIIEMDWAEGNTLLDEVDELWRNRDRQGLQELGERWKDLVLELDRVQMAHGDLAGENVMVVGKRLVLIDYDGVFFDEPVLRDHPPNERGNAKYQHREAQQRRVYNGRMDDFSALAIYVAILAIAEDPKLFKYADPTEGKLLYEASDLADPGHSKVFADLRGLQNPAVRELVKKLEDACVKPIDQVPKFRDVLPAPPDPFAELKRLAKEPPPLDWSEIQRVEAAGKLLTQPGFPKELKGPVDEAKRRVKARDAVQTAIQGRSAEEIKKQYLANKGLLNAKDWRPQERIDELIRQGEQALKQVQKIAELKKAGPEDRGSGGLVQLWSGAVNLLWGHAQGAMCKEVDDLPSELEPWWAINTACDELDQVMPPQKTKPGGRSAPAFIWDWDEDVALAWQNLEEACGKIRWPVPSSLTATGGWQRFEKACREAKQTLCHPDAQSRASVARGCIDRWNCLRHALDVPDELSERPDREYVARWNDNLLKQCPDAQKARPPSTTPGRKHSGRKIAPRQRWETANARIKILDDLQAKIRQVEQGKGEEQEIVDKAAGLPDGYQYNQSSRVAKAKDRAAAKTRYDTAARMKPRSERQIAAAWAEWLAKYDAKDQGTRSPAPLTFQDLARIGQQVALLNRLDATLERLECKKTDEEVEGISKDALLQDCHDVLAYRSEFTRRAKRLAQVRRLCKEIADAHARAPGSGSRKIADAGKDLPDEYLQHSSTSLNNHEVNLNIRLGAARQQAKFTVRLQDQFDLEAARQSDRTIADALDGLEKAEKVGDLHTEADPAADPFREAAKTARTRRDRLKVLASAFDRVMDECDEENDSAVLNAWTADDDALFKDRRDAAANLRRVAAARLRHGLDDIIGKVDGGQLDEAEIIKFAKVVLRDAGKLTKKQEARRDKAKERAEALLALETAITNNDDWEIDRCFRELRTRKIGVRNEENLRRGELASRRVGRLKAIEDLLDQHFLVDKEDIELLGLWDKPDPDGEKVDMAACKVATKHRPRINTARERRALWDRFIGAVGRSDAAAIVDCANKPLLGGYPPIKSYKEKIARARKAIALFGHLERGDRAAFVHDFDAKLPGEFAELYRPRFSEARGCIKDWLLSQYRLQKIPQYRRPQVLARGEPMLKVYWSWPDFAKVNSCIVVAHWGEPIQNLNGKLADRSLSSDLEVSHADYTRLACSAELPIPRKFDRALQVSIWPVVEMAPGERVVGCPLHLEPLKAKDVVNQGGGQPGPSGWRELVRKALDF